MAFEQFVHVEGTRLRRALVAYYGLEVGSEAADDCLAFAWERWPEVERMENPAGYLFRVGQTRARPHLRWASRRRMFPTADVASSAPDADAVLDVLDALGRLSAHQRAAVMLVKSFGYSHREVADLLGVSEVAVNNLVHRGVVRLRSIMGAST